MGTIPEHIVAELAASDCHEIAHALGLQGTRARHKFACVADGCASSDAMHIYPGERGAYCYSCGTGFDAIGLVRQSLSLGFVESCEWLAKQQGMEDIARGEVNLAEQRRRIRVREKARAARQLEAARMRQLRKDVASETYEILWHRMQLGPIAAEWLKGRGICYEAAWDVGLRSVETESEWHALWRSRDDVELEMVGLQKTPWRTPFLAIPYWKREGGIDMLRFRHLWPARAKYLSPRGLRLGIPYMAHEAYQAADDFEALYVTEGELDALTLICAGHCAVGSPGASAWRADWCGPWKWFRRVHVLCDGDDAGRKFGERLRADATAKLGATWTAQRLSVHMLPDGADVNDLHQRSELTHYMGTL